MNAVMKAPRLVRYAAGVLALASSAAWAAGNDIADLPHAAAPQPPGPPRDVFVFFISAAKHRNPAAAMALQSRVDALA